MVERRRPKRRIMRTFKLDEISAVDNPAQAHARAVLMKRADPTPEQAEEYFKRTFSADQRKKLAEEGKALSDGSYPIVTRTDLSNAVQAFGRAKNKGRVKRHIVARARALGALDALPEDWNVSKGTKKAADAVGKDYYDGAAYPTELAENIQAVDFDTVLAEQEAREAAHEVGEDLREKWCALQRSFNTIAADESVSAADKVTAMQASLRQYIDSLAEQSTEIAETMSKCLSADPALSGLLEKAEEGDDEMNAAVKKQLDELQKTVTDLAKQVADAPDDAKPDLAKQLEAVQAQITGLVEKAAADDAEHTELVAKAGMSDDEKAYMDKMSPEDKKGFMAMSPEDRKKQMKKAADDDPVVYKSEATGTEFRKSDDPRLVEMAKQSDKDRARADDMAKRAETAELAKRADDELSAFSEEVAKRDDKIEVLRAIEKMDEGPRAAVLKMLEVGGKAIEAAFTTIGHNQETLAKTGGDFQKRVREVQKRDECSEDVAMQKAAREFPDEFAAYQEAGQQEAPN